MPPLLFINRGVAALEGPLCDAEQTVAASSADEAINPISVQIKKYL